MHKIIASFILIMSLTFASFPNYTHAATRAEMLAQIEQLTQLITLLQAQLQARTEGRDAQIKSTLSTVRAQAEIFYNNNKYGYAGLCYDASITELLSTAEKYVPNLQVPVAINSATTPKIPNKINCYSGLDYYMIISSLNQGKAYCVDSTGFAGVRESLKIADSQRQCDSSTE